MYIYTVYSMIIFVHMKAWSAHLYRWVLPHTLQKGWMFGALSQTACNICTTALITTPSEIGWNQHLAISAKSKMFSPGTLARVERVRKLADGLLNTLHRSCSHSCPSGLCLETQSDLVNLTYSPTQKRTKLLKKRKRTPVVWFSRVELCMILSSKKGPSLDCHGSTASTPHHIEGGSCSFPHRMYHECAIQKKLYIVK